MELEIQKFLRAGNNFTKLKDTYGIKAKLSEVFPELVLFKYNQLESPMGEAIVQECRGIILNSEDDWRVISRPYNKFFNYGEGHAAKIDWDNARIYDKLDGSLMTLYWYKDQWNVSTSGHPDALGPVSNLLGEDLTFAELFWKTWKELEYDFPKDQTDFCFMFELMTPLNKVVVQHKENKLVLHGSRSIEVGYEVCPEYWCSLLNWDCCSIFNFSTIEEVIETSKTLDPINNEGYIIVDDDFNRIKVKSPQYVALSHMKDSLSTRGLLEIIRNNESEEFLNYFEEYKELHDKVKLAWSNTISNIQYTVDCIYKEYGSNPSRKEVGLHTKGLSFQGILFPIIFDGKTVKEMLQNMVIKKLEGLVKEFNEGRK